nr:YceD family protein [Fructilactobacillus florum]
MKWSFEKLQGYVKQPFTEQATLTIQKQLQARYPDEIISATAFEVSVVARADQGDVIVDADISGSVTVPSSRSLIPVTLPLDFHVTEIYVAAEAALRRYENNEIVLIVDDSGTIDFETAVVDNVLVQIPMQVLTPSERAGADMPAGEDWKVVSEDEYRKQRARTNQVDPRLATYRVFILTSQTSINNSLVEIKFKGGFANGSSKTKNIKSSA